MIEFILLCGNIVYIDAEQVIAVKGYPGYSGTDIVLSSGNSYMVRDTPSQVLSKIKE